MNFSLFQKLRDAKAGDEWYNMKAVEMTPELQNDLKAIQMRSVLDPKRFYRKNDMKTLPKYFQVRYKFPCVSMSVI